jgi:hypothetical protein
MNRESVYQSFFETIQSLAQFKTASRRLRHWSNVSFADQPALFVTQGKERQEPRRGLPPKVFLSCQIYVYVNSGEDENGVPASLLNPIGDAIDAALAPDPATGLQTLGDTVSHCWIEGEIANDEGVLGPQAVAIIPISILVNN